MFSEDLECQKLLMEAMKYHLLPERRPMLQSPRTKPRKSTVGSLYAVGGMDASKGGPLFSSFLTFLIAIPLIPIVPKGQLLAEQRATLQLTINYESV